MHVFKHESNDIGRACTTFPLYPASLLHIMSPSVSMGPAPGMRQRFISRGVEEKDEYLPSNKIRSGPQCTQQRVGNLSFGLYLAKGVESWSGVKPLFTNRAYPKASPGVAVKKRQSQCNWRQDARLTIA